MKHEFDIGIRPGVLVWTGLFSLSGFVILALLVRQDMTADVDHVLLMWFSDSRGQMRAPPWLQETLADLTALGGYPVLVLLIMLCLCGLCLMRQFASARLLLFAVVGGSLLSSLLKRVFDRSRPDLFTHLDLTFTSSFPSAHAMVSMLVWLMLSLVIGGLVARPVLQRYLLGAAVLISGLVGFSRVFLGVHWPTDVVAGWLMGIAWVCGCCLWWHPRQRGAATANDGRRGRVRSAGVTAGASAGASAGAIPPSSMDQQVASNER